MTDHNSPHSLLENASLFILLFVPFSTLLFVFFLLIYFFIFTLFYQFKYDLSADVDTSKKIKHKDIQPSPEPRNMDYGLLTDQNRKLLVIQHHITQG